MLEVDYFDGRAARPQRACVSVQGRSLSIRWAGGERSVDLSDVQWPERRRHGARVAHLAQRTGGGSLSSHDAAAWDAFVRALPLAARAGEGWIVRAQQSWRGTALAALLVGVIGVGGYLWGVPLAARGVLLATPHEVDAAVGRLALQGVEGQWLLPTQTPAPERERIASAFARMVEAGFPDLRARPAYELRFHASRIGPNAFALPGGTIVITDELLTLMQGRDEVVLGVLAHELGHVRARHGMRLLVRVSLIGAATSVALGDFNSVLAGVPALLGQLGYSRDAEREADAESVRLLRAAGLSPAVMAEFFERVRGWRVSPEGRQRGADADLGIAFSTHPADAERVAFFRSAAP